VFVVGCLGDWTRAAQVLFERESVQRDSSSRRTPGQGASADAEGCAGTVSSKWAKGTGGPAGDECYNLTTQPIGYRWQNNRDGLQQDDAVAAMRASTEGSGFHEMNHPVVVQPVPFRDVSPTLTSRMQGSSGWAPVNEDAHLVGQPVPFTKSKRAQSVTDDETWVDGQVNPTLSLFDQGDTRATTVAVAHVETLPQQGYDAFHASTQETNAVATLRTLRSQIGEEAFAAWGLGILDSLQPQEVLRARLHGLGIRCATFSRSWPIDCAISRKEDRATWAMQSVREAQGEGCPSPGWQLPQQLAAELGAYLSELPRPGAQTERFVRDLWLAGERIGFLREALSAFQETRRPAHREGQSALHTMQVRRLTATECEFLQGFPRNYTLIPWRKKQAEDCPDGPRYRALGNSMAVNCMAWIGERIAALENNR
jgi:DNA (cytosine-5)-methyltransferase 1